MPSRICAFLLFGLFGLLPRLSNAALLSWYRFDDGTGALVTDSSGNGNSLSANAGGFLWNQKAGAPFGGSIHFNGTGTAIAQKTSVLTQSQTIDFLRARTSNKVTIAFWANPDTQGQATSPFGFVRSTNQRILQSHLLWTNNTAFWDVGYPATTDVYYRLNSATTTSTPGQWTHWVFMFDAANTSQTMKIYRNGTLLASSATGANGSIDWASIAVAEIGGSQIYGSTRWAGSMDDFAIWDEALTPAQISTIMTSGVQAVVAPKINSFIATPGNIAPGGTSTLSWNVTAATSLSIDQGVGAVSGATGSVNVSPAANTTYRLTATNTAGTVTKDVLVAVGAAEQPLVLNEFLADNGSGILDEDGTRQDWIEIYNPNPFAISANGWKLVAGTTTWTFPNVQIEGGQYLIVFASAKNRITPGAPLHTNFKLSTSGEYLALKKPDDTVVTEFAPAFPIQRTDVSCGLSGGTVVYYPTPTPGGPNGSTVAGLVDDTAFSVKRGFYTTPQSVAIVCATPGSTIRYTTDNSTPTDTNGTVYSAPLNISSTTILRARAFKPGYLASNTDTQTYVFVADIPGQVYASGTAPSGWPVPGSAQLNSQAMRYGFNATLKAQYTSQTLLDALNQVPSLSIVTDQANLTGQTTGVYVNADQKGDAWERISSVEYLNPDNSSGFHINCGLRIRGGASRGDNYPKHSFRLYFRKGYGDASLKFPLHGTSGTDEFETIDIRSEENYSWANDTGTQNTAVREVFSRDLSGAMGQPQTRSRYLHVYLNGQYWGLYMTEERAQEDYAASYFGGVSDDYDVVQTSNHPNFTYEVASGAVDAWQQTWNLARACAANPTNANYFALLGRDANGNRVTGMPVYIDPDHLATYMLLHYYTGDGDGPLSNFLSLNRANNWRGFRNRTNDLGWRFFPHDCEHTLLAPSWLDTRATGNAGAGTTPTNGSNRSNFTYSNSEWIHEDLATNAEYRLKIADVAQKHLFNNGSLTPAKAQPLFDARAAQINQAIVADCVRWGTDATNHTFAQWQSRLNNIRTTFFPARHTSVINQLKTRGFYPNVNPPTFSQRGGVVSSGYQLTLDAGGQTGSIYYTLNGVDPRAVGGAATGTLYTGPITVTGPTTVRTRFLGTGNVWSAIDEATFSLNPPAVAGKVVISKINYHPADPTPAEVTAGYTDADAFEYLELQNISNETLDILGLQITDGVMFSFANSPINSLAPAGRALVVANPAAFAFRYGNGLPIAGTYAGNLSNGGEFLRVADGTGQTVVQFAYDDASPWPTNADGFGSALILQNFPPADPALGYNWRASYVPGGVPGGVDAWTIDLWRKFYFSAADLTDPSKEATVWGNNADPDSDGWSNLLEFALGSSPTMATAFPVQYTTIYTDPNSQLRYLRLVAGVRDGLINTTITAVGSSDLVNWNIGPALVGPPTPQADGTSTYTWQDSTPMSGNPSDKRFLRLQINTQ